MPNKKLPLLAALLILLFLYLLSIGPVLCLTIGWDDDQPVWAVVAEVAYLPVFAAADASPRIKAILEWYVTLWAPLIIELPEA
jgi:hypothetical protein